MHKTFTSIPELVEELSRYLRPRDLFTCVQVSSRWNKIFIPFLWHTIDDTTPSWKSILWQCGDSAIRFKHPYLEGVVIDSDKNKDREWLLHVFRKYGSHIRDLSIHWPMVLEAASMATLGNCDSEGGGCVALVSLTLDISSAPAPEISYYDMMMTRQCLARPPRPEAMPAIAVSSALLFPGLVFEDEFIQPEHYERDGSTLEFQKECVESGWVWTQHYWNLILSNHGLVKLIMGGGPVLQWRIKPEQVLLKAIAQMPRLKELQCWGFDNMAFIWTLLSAAPKLESLTTFCRKFQLPDPLPKINTTLRILSFPSDRDDFVMEINHVLDVLRLFPNIYTLTVPRIWFHVTPGPPKDPAVFANLRELVVHHVDEYDKLMTYVPDDVELSCFQHIHLMEYYLPEAMMLSGPRFGVFKTTVSNRWSSSADEKRNEININEIFATSSRLRVFDESMKYILVDEILRQPWLCMGLEWLTCSIVDIDRLTDDEQSLVNRVMAPGYLSDLSARESAAVEKFERCRAQHHGVYDHLASLVKLKHLDLGYENRYPQWDEGQLLTHEVDGKKYLRLNGPTFDTLELTLASGLGRLGALKDLEMIGFEGINHRIGRPELEWMARSWPKLNLMYGLDKDRLKGIEPDREKAALKSYFQRLRPDVVHDSLLAGIWFPD